MKIFFIVVLLIGVLVGIMYLFPQINFRAMPSGLIEGKLPEAKPNWVSSFVAKTDAHYIAPFHVESLSKLSTCIKEKIPEVIIQKTDSSTILAYRQSQVFHFVDWLCIHADGNVVSSATMGHSDFGKNRELIEKIRTVCF